MMAAGQRIQTWSDSRPRPRIAPTGSAITRLSAAAFRVCQRPGSRKVVQTSAVANGFHLLGASSARLLSVMSTQATTAASTSENRIV